MLKNDTIAAISTPPGKGGIGIVRISGDEAFNIASVIFKGNKCFKDYDSHTINYGKIVDPITKETIDEVLVSKLNKPSSFTTEDIVEINCHGGIVTVKKILEVVIREGARIAEPGEFTKRAFLNGRIDLSQAEAVIDLINSKTSEGSKAALNQLEGKLSKKIKDVRENLIELIAHIEVTVDYPEHDIEEITGDKVYDDLKPIKNKLTNIIKGFDKGRVLREGINVVIVGRPNTGKSSLLNELSGKSKAIVTDIPGTTRDIIEEYINISGIPVRLVDTAGIRETDDIVERIGVERAKKEINSADLVIMMIDAQEGLLDEDLDIFNEVKEMKLLVLVNKIDVSKDSYLRSIEERFEGYRIIKSSLIEGIGIDILEDEIKNLFLKGSLELNDEILVTNVRHKNLIDLALKSIENAIMAYENGMPLDLMTIDIKDATEYLGQITGESVTEDVLHKIFEKFCIGK